MYILFITIEDEMTLYIFNNIRTVYEYIYKMTFFKISFGYYLFVLFRYLKKDRKDLMRQQSWKNT